MKKIIFALLLGIASSLMITSCTEEEVAPSTENGGAVAEDGVRR